MDGCEIDFSSISESIAEMKTDDKVILTKMKDLSSCDTTSFEDVVQGSVKNATAIFNAREIPNNLLECDGSSCDFTGSVILTRNEDEKLTETDPISFTSLIDINFVRYANGIVYFYINAPHDTDATITLTASDISSDTQANADVFTTNKKLVKGWNYVSYELAAPTSTIGTGWAKAAVGALFKISVTDPNAVAGDQWAFSTLLPFEDIEDLEQSETVVLSCVSEATLELANSLTEADGCTARSWDPNGQALTGNLVASLISGDREAFAPGAKRSKEEYVEDMKEIEAVVEAETINGKSAGTIMLNKLSTEDDACGMIVVRIKKSDCQADSFRYVSGKDLHTLNDAQFYVIDNKLILSDEYVGSDAVVIYPVRKRAKVWDITQKGLASRTRVKMHLKVSGGDGIPARVFYSDQVFLTSFPFGAVNGTSTITLPLEFGNYKGRVAKVAVLG
ncbi:hypothetical protein [Enterococcus avium]|uniref:hypothetical protein n=1 Tax=Enterococcus avium TaxID=33945 RepID=UPI001F588DC2|nr:hypothetical protein [Enterococcus avium]